jgi:hypothetical protein
VPAGSETTQANRGGRWFGRALLRITARLQRLSLPGVAEHQRPGQAVAELRADLGVGGDPAGVVIRRSGDQARPEYP